MLVYLTVHEKVDLLTMRLEQGGGGSVDKPDNADQIDGATMKTAKKCKLHCGLSVYIGDLSYYELVW